MSGKKNVMKKTVCLENEYPPLADKETRVAFLELWDMAKEADSYDKKKWNNFRNILHSKGVFV